MSNSRGILVPRDIEDLRAFPSRLVADELERRFAVADDDRKLPLAYALADPDFGKVKREFLIKATASTAHSEECDNIAAALAHHRQLSLQDRPGRHRGPHARPPSCIQDKAGRGGPSLGRPIHRGGNVKC